MIENLLLQQVLLYTREHSNPSHYFHSRRSRPRTSNSLWIRQQPRLSENPDHEHLVLTSSRYQHNHDEEPTLCLIESNPENSSSLIENILHQYNQRKDQYTRFDQDLMDLLLKRNRQRKNSSLCTNNNNSYRRQWLAIGLVIDRLFFYTYFTATFVSYLVTLWLIPFSHPNLTIDIHSF
jgi:hypothetical protein